MKNYLISICILFLLSDLNAQTLLDIYKKGTVKLIPDKDYAQDNQWDKLLLGSHYDTIYKTFKPGMGYRKSIILMRDGSVVVNHPYCSSYSLFDKNGNFVKDFNILNFEKSGNEFQNTAAIEGIINNNFFTAMNNNGRIICFDFDGKYIKTLQQNSMIYTMLPLTDNKIALVGMNPGLKDFVSILDYNTNKQNIIWENENTYNVRNKNPKNEVENNKREMFNYIYFFENGSHISFTTQPLSTTVRKSLQPIIAFAKNRLIVAFPQNGEILIYNIKGKLISKEKIEWGRKYITVEEQKEIQKQAIEKYTNRKKQLSTSKDELDLEYVKAFETIIKQMEEDLEKINTPILKPVFSTIIKDSDDNLLFFEIPETEGANKFNVWIYQDGGKFICQSSFVCDDYDLSITPSKMVFHNGYIYSLQVLKNATGNPLRLVRFKLSN